MELKQIRQFVALSDAQNFHRAAKALNMSQPPLSISIKKLEEEMGVRLFERHARGVKLTEAGLAALPYARKVLTGMEAMRRGDRQHARELFQLAQARCPTVSELNWAASSELKKL